MTQLRNTAEQVEASAVEPINYLLGIPTLAEYVKFVQRRTIGGASADESALIEQWCAVDDRYRALEKTEANIADSIEIHDLPDRVTSLVKHVLEDRYFARCFNNVPVAFAMVELDKLVVTQEDIVQTHLHRLRERWGDTPTIEQIFKVCLPYERNEPSVKYIKTGGNSFVFQSESADLRFFSPKLLSPELTAQVPANGTLAGVVALSVGFGPNYLSGIRVGKRVFLNNGYHRANSLRAMGITHAPMAIQVISRTDELEFVGGAAKADNLTELSERPRPPLLQDYFNSQLSTLLQCMPTKRQIQVTYEVNSVRVPI